MPAPLVERRLVNRDDLRALEQRFMDLLRAHQELDDVRHQAGDLRLSQADRDLERRLKEMNEFRAQINLERAHYMLREVFEREMANTSDRIKQLEIGRGEQAGRSAAYASVVAVIVILIQFLLHFWK